MDFSLSDDQQLLQNTVRSFVANESPPQTLRAVFDGECRPLTKLWQGLAQLGVTGLVIPEAHGGAGLELLELALVAEELGRGAVPVPFLGHALATLALAHGGSRAQQAAWLPPLAAGELRATVAFAEGDGCWLPEMWRADLVSGRLRGVKQYVPEAEGADLFVVGCRDGKLALVAAGPDVRVAPEPTLDRGRPLARLELDGAPADPLDADATKLVDAA